MSDPLFSGLRARLAAEDVSIAATWARQELEWGEGKGLRRTARIFGIPEGEVLDALQRAAGMDGP